MKTSAILIAITALAGVAVAVPTPAPAADAAPSPILEKRQSNGVFVGEHAHYGGRTEHLRVAVGVCHTLGNGWPNIITAFGPDPGRVCTIYDDNFCSGASYANIVNPGFPDLGIIGWNDRINSFRCF
ncbi:hypothetical protein QBC35DRAFT_388652 [Podospora australis]|uniref:Beta/gamma crystallin 'Greek key' domain-containing protein n=1 Tax=Podospora australis TaxID=1536484 RepID=A0AAN7AEQ1_9PEZI|nr:hypothetical protein QBC35DRAFT_388652 [Podospora australis]